MFITEYEPYNVEPVARPVGRVPSGAVVFANLWGGQKCYGMVVVEKHKTFVKAANLTFPNGQQRIRFPV